MREAAKKKKLIANDYIGGGDICYGYAMYCSRKDFDDYHHAIGETCDYDTMNAQIDHADSGFFSGWGDSDAGDSGDGGGDGGGD